VVFLLPTPPPAQGRPGDSHGPANDGIRHPRTLFDILDDFHHSTDRLFPVFCFFLLFFLAPPARKVYMPIANPSPQSSSPPIQLLLQIPDFPLKLFLLRIQGNRGFSGRKILQRLRHRRQRPIFPLVIRLAGDPQTLRPSVAVKAHCVSAK